MREIISLSLGKSSNYAHSHFWNMQDEWLKDATTATQQQQTEGQKAREGGDHHVVLYYESM